MRKLVAVVICAGMIVAAPASARVPSPPLLRLAAARSGLTILRKVPVIREPARRYDAHTTSALNRMYPPALQQLDTSLYTDLGLLGPDDTLRKTLLAGSLPVRYDAAAHAVRVRRASKTRRAQWLDAYIRALTDQHYNLRRLDPLRTHDRDASLAASATVDGFASTHSGLRTTTRSASPLDRFLATERATAAAAGRTLVARLDDIGGRPAVRTALRTFPQTTAQLLHVDKFLQHERGDTPKLPEHAGDLALSATETFGELDVRALLAAFGVPNAAAVADGWAGGALALYRGSDTQSAAALILRWDTVEDADEWRTAARAYVAGAFPAAAAHTCPAVDACWLDGNRELALAVRGTWAAFASGTEAEVLAAASLPISTSS